MLSFRNETLKNISQDQRKDKFLFNVNNSTFEVPLSYAIGISPFILEKYLQDPTFRELKIEDREKIEDILPNFLEGKEIPQEIFLKLGKLFKNKEMIQKWSKFHQITNKSINEFLLSKVSDIDDMKAFKGNIKYITNNLEELKEDLKFLPEEELIYLIRNEDLKVEKEDTI